MQDNREEGEGKEVFISFNGAGENGKRSIQF